MRRQSTAITVSLVILAVFGGVTALKHAFFPSAAYRYRMTVEVETPQGLRRGSAVREATLHPLTWISNARWELHGEAVVIRLSNETTVFALLSAPGCREYSKWITGPLIDSIQSDSSLANRAIPLWPSAPQAFVSSPVPTLPSLVTFLDPTDPLSVVEIDPEHFSNIFGSGVTLKSVSLELTDDPVTTEVSEVLPWIKEFGKSSFSGERDVISSSPVDTLSLGDFSTEIR